MKNVLLVITRYGSGIALGIEATTPTTKNAKADAEAAREAIEVVANTFRNTTGWTGEVSYTHERFGFISMTEERFREGLAEAVRVEIRTNYYNSPVPISWRDLRAEFKLAEVLAEEQFDSIPRENFIGAQVLRNQEIHAIGSL